MNNNKNLIAKLLAAGLPWLKAARPGWIALGGGW